MSRETRGSSAYTTVDVAKICDLVQFVIETLCEECPSRDACTIWKAEQEAERNEA